MTKQEQVLSEARSWLGTPWHHMGDENAVAIKGVCVDCAVLLVEVFKAAGLVPQSLNPCPYSMDWNIHRNEEKFLGWLEQYGDEVVTPQAGDVAVWQYGRVFSHGAIVIDDAGTMVHAYRTAKMVTLGNLFEHELRYQKNGQLRPVKFFRVRGIEVGVKA